MPGSFSETGSLLTMNSGSSSLKFALFDAGAEAPATARGEITDLDAAPHLLACDGGGAVVADHRWPAGLPDPFATVLDALLAFADSHLDRGGLAAVGHRIVHGGPHHAAPALVTPDLLGQLEALFPLDPLHMPHNVAPIHAVGKTRPELPQVACFDTAFHHTLPREARWFGLPRALEAEGVRRYGFHGLSYEFIADRLSMEAPALARGRVVVAERGVTAGWCCAFPSRSPGVPRLADEIVTALYGRIATGEIDCLDAVFCRWRPGHPFGIERRHLFPLDPNALPAPEERHAPLLDLKPTVLLRYLTSDYLHALLCDAALNGFAAENEARMEAMAAAHGQIERQALAAGTTPEPLPMTTTVTLSRGRSG